MFLLILDTEVSSSCSLVQTLANSHILCVSYYTAVDLSSTSPGVQQELSGCSKPSNE